MNKIMPLGASRVEGARPVFESYRYELWKLLNADSFEFDFVGTKTDEATYPLFEGEQFDPDHEGRGGWTSQQILNNISSWLDDTGPVDVVLFSSPGGNDILSASATVDEMLDNINQIIDIIQEDNPNVVIIVEKLAPGRMDFMTPEYTAAFLRMQDEVESLAQAQTTSTSQVLAVDMASGFDDDYLADNVHYNTAGAVFVANRYYSTLQTVLTR